MTAFLERDLRSDNRQSVPRVSGTVSDPPETWEAKRQDCADKIRYCTAIVAAAGFYSSYSLHHKTAHFMVAK